ncbi:MAG: hypothetical protein JRD93_09835 [Deltaproteobacteria bacterium]|nr:hypothetical protein [Deltaproteobacteria bacterium]MBW2662268.1 hypothetical protein [Deltaproteobacteria bacterium]
MPDSKAKAPTSQRKKVKNPNPEDQVFQDTINRITEYLKSLGYKVSKNFVSACINWFEDAYFLFSVPIFSPSVLKQNANANKYTA